MLKGDIWTFVMYLGVGLLGGILGEKLKVPSGAMIGSMIAVIALKFYLNSGWSIPSGYNLLVQVLIGIMIGATFERHMLDCLSRLAIPIITSTLVLVAAGMLLTVIYAKAGLIDLETGYLGTNPGAISVLVSVAAERNADPTIVLTFHFVRVVFVVLTAPWIVRILSAWR